MSASPRSPQPAVASPAALRSRTVVVSFLGAVVQRMGGWMPIGATVDLLTLVGIDAPSVRTAVFRLKRRGWLASETRGGVRGYALTETALAALAAGDEIIWHARQPADLADGWCVVSFSVPESERTLRHQLRSYLASLGFGNVGAGMWIAPARMARAADRAVSELGLTGRSAIFVGAYAGGQDLPSLLSSAWDLDEIDERYQDFVDRYRPLADTGAAPGVTEPIQAFASYLGMVDHWRRLPYRDPGLPAEVLPADWSGPAAGALFERLVELLQGDAMAYAATLWPAAERPET